VHFKKVPESDANKDGECSKWAYRFFHQRVPTFIGGREPGGGGLEGLGVDNRLVVKETYNNTTLEGQEDGTSAWRRWVLHAGGRCGGHGKVGGGGPELLGVARFISSRAS